MCAPTVQEIAATPKHLGGQIGFLAVLHTWGQPLLEHPHLHCVVPGGGLATDGSRWIAAQEDFFLPVNQQKQIFPNGQGRSAGVAMGTSDKRCACQDRLCSFPPIDGFQRGKEER